MDGGEPGRRGTQQDVRFCAAADGVRIAYAVHGSGPPLMVNSCWLSHLQHDWESPVWRHFLEGLGEFATVVRYDERGYGLSDWDVGDLSLEARIGDLETVVEAAGLDRFALLGNSQGGPVAIAYAVRHPDRVSRLVLSGTHATLARNAEQEEMLDTLLQLVRVGWSRPDSTFRRVFTTSMIPNATAEQMRWVDELLRMSTSAETAYAATSARREVDVTHLLALVPQPTLVLHSRGDRMKDFSEGRLLASTIPDATLVALETDNHILLADEPAWQVFLDAVRSFLGAGRVPADAVAAGDTPSTGLSTRESEVLRMAARGLDNATIADELTLSIRTVERHLSNVYVKLGLTGRTARTAAVARFLSS